MSDRRQFQSSLTTSPELQRLIDEARKREVSEEELQEQRVSFAFGNAPRDSASTKDSVRNSSQHIRLNTAK